MTVGEALARAEELRPGCQITARTRQRWLCEADGMLREKFFRPSSADSREGVGADIAWDNGLRDDDVLLVPPPDLPVPAVQGGAVETLLTHLIRENEKQGQLDLLCASVTDDAARRAAEGWQHTKMLYINRPGGHRRYWPMVFLERCAGIAAPYDPWYQKVQLSLALYT